MAERPSQVIVDKVIGYKLADSEKKFQNNDCILYALGIGFNNDPLLKKDLNFTYELSDNFKVFPTYATSFLDIGLVSEIMSNCPGLPEISPMNILHGMHTLTLHKPLKKEGIYYNKAILEDIQDKEKGALVVIKTDSFDDKDRTNLIFTNRMMLFIRGIGGFDSQKTKKPTVNLDIPPIEKRKPDLVNEQITLPNQALLFRLNGDFNPLHADPQLAEMGRFPRPILHGLCTYGITAKLILDKISEYDIDIIETVHTRFMSHVFPGETISVNGWISKDDNSIVFEGICKDRNKVIANGIIKLKKGCKPKL